MSNQVKLRELNDELDAWINTSLNAQAFEFVDKVPTVIHHPSSIKRQIVKSLVRNNSFSDAILNGDYLQAASVAEVDFIGRYYLLENLRALPRTSVIRALPARLQSRILQLQPVEQIKTFKRYIQAQQYRTKQLNLIGRSMNFSPFLALAISYLKGDVCFELLQRTFYHLNLKTS